MLSKKLVFFLFVYFIFFTCQFSFANENTDVPVTVYIKPFEDGASFTYGKYCFMVIDPNSALDIYKKCFGYYENEPHNQFEASLDLKLFKTYSFKYWIEDANNSTFWEKQRYVKIRNKNQIINLKIPHDQFVTLNINLYAYNENNEQIPYDSGGYLYFYRDLGNLKVNTDVIVDQNNLKTDYDALWYWMYQSSGTYVIPKGKYLIYFEPAGWWNYGQELFVYWRYFKKSFFSDTNLDLFVNDGFADLTVEFDKKLSKDSWIQIIPQRGFSDYDFLRTYIEDVIPANTQYYNKKVPAGSSFVTIKLNEKPSKYFDNNVFSREYYFKRGTHKTISLHSDYDYSKIASKYDKDKEITVCTNSIAGRKRVEIYNMFSDSPIYISDEFETGCITTEKLRLGIYKILLVNLDYNTQNRRTINTRISNNITIGDDQYNTSQNVTLNIKGENNEELSDFTIDVFKKEKKEKVISTTNPSFTLEKGHYTVIVSKDGYLPGNINIIATSGSKSYNVFLSKPSQYRKIDVEIRFPDIKAFVVQNLNVEGIIYSNNEKVSNSILVNGNISSLDGNDKKWIATFDVPVNRKIYLTATADLVSGNTTVKVEKRLRIKVDYPNDSTDSYIYYNEDTQTWENSTQKSAYNRPYFIMNFDIVGSWYRLLCIEKDPSLNVRDAGSCTDITVDVKGNRLIKSYDFQGLDYIWLPDNAYVTIKALVNTGTDVEKYYGFIGGNTYYKSNHEVVFRGKTPIPYDKNKYDSPAIVLSYSRSSNQKANIEIALEGYFTKPYDLNEKYNFNYQYIRTTVYVESVDNSCLPVFIGGFRDYSKPCKPRFRDKIDDFFRNGLTEYFPAAENITAHYKKRASYIMGVPFDNVEYVVYGFSQVRVLKNVLVKEISGKLVSIPVFETKKVPFEPIYLKPFKETNSDRYMYKSFEVSLSEYNAPQSKLPAYVIYTDASLSNFWYYGYNLDNCVEKKSYTIAGVDFGLYDCSGTKVIAPGVIGHATAYNVLIAKNDSAREVNVANFNNEFNDFTRDLLTNVYVPGNPYFTYQYIGDNNDVVTKTLYINGPEAEDLIENCEHMCPKKNVLNTGFATQSGVAGIILKSLPFDFWTHYGIVIKVDQRHIVHLATTWKNDTTGYRLTTELAKDNFKDTDSKYFSVVLTHQNGDVFPLAIRLKGLDDPTGNSSDAWKNFYISVSFKDSANNTIYKKFKLYSKNLSSQYSFQFKIKGNEPISLILYNYYDTPLATANITSTQNVFAYAVKQQDLFAGSNSGTKILVLKANSTKPNGFKGKRVFVSINPLVIGTARYFTQGITSDAYAWFGGDVYELPVDPSNPQQTKEITVPYNSDKVTVCFYTDDIATAFDHTWISQFIKYMEREVKGTLQEGEILISELFDKEHVYKYTMKQPYLWYLTTRTLYSQVTQFNATIPYISEPTVELKTYNVTVTVQSDQGFYPSLIDSAAVLLFLNSIDIAKFSFSKLENVIKHSADLIDEALKCYHNPICHKYTNSTFAFKKVGEELVIENLITKEFTNLQTFINTFNSLKKSAESIRKINSIKNRLSLFTSQPFTKLIGILKPVITTTLPFGGLPPSGMPLIHVKSAFDSKFVVPNCEGCSEALQIRQWLTNYFNKPLATKPVTIPVQVRHGNSIIVKISAAGHTTYQTIIHVDKNTPQNLEVNAQLWRTISYAYNNLQNFFETHPAIEELFEEFLLAPELYAGSSERLSILEYIAQGLVSLEEAIAQDFKLEGLLSEN